MTDINVRDNIDNDPINLGILTAVGNTNAILSNGSTNGFIFQFVIANIDTSVDVMAQGSLDGVNWWNIDSEVTQYTANGAYALHYPYGAPFVRGRMDAETGGTAVTVGIKCWPQVRG